MKVVASLLLPCPHLLRVNSPFSRFIFRSSFLCEYAARNRPLPLKAAVIIFDKIVLLVNTSTKYATTAALKTSNPQNQLFYSKLLASFANRPAFDDENTSGPIAYKTPEGFLLLRLSGALNRLDCLSEGNLSFVHLKSGKTSADKGLRFIFY